MVELTRRGASRLKREKQTVRTMIRLYCSRNHTSAGGVCSECEELLEYASRRLDRCPFMNQKPACSNCRVHCYEPAKREQMRQVMRFSGPRMLWRHPILAVRHLIDARKKAGLE